MSSIILSMKRLTANSRIKISFEKYFVEIAQFINAILWNLKMHKQKHIYIFFFDQNKWIK